MTSREALHRAMRRLAARIDALDRATSADDGSGLEKATQADRGIIVKFFTEVADGGMPEKEWAKRNPRAYRRLGKIAGFVEVEEPDDRPLRRKETGDAS